LENKKTKIGALLITALIASVGLYGVWANLGLRNTGLNDAQEELSLVRPGFAQLMAAATSSLGQEAGMAIWLHTSPFQSLDAAKNALYDENFTSDYVIGSLDMTKAYLGMAAVSSPNSPSDDDPHCIVNKDGWIVVYYLRVNMANPSGVSGWLGKMIVLSSSDFYNDATHTMNNNLLHMALVYISSQMLVSDVSSAQYYNFQYPAATTLLIAIKTSVSDVYYGYTKTFNINIPNGTVLDEQSWSFYADFAKRAGFLIDTTAIVNRPNYSGSARYYYDLVGSNSTLLTPNTGWHTVSVFVDGNSGKASVCLLILYH
jgi:hypothetical protein